MNPQPPKKYQSRIQRREGGGFMVDNKDMMVQQQQQQEPPPHRPILRNPLLSPAAPLSSSSRLHKATSDSPPFFTPSHTHATSTHSHASSPITTAHKQNSLKVILKVSNSSSNSSPSPSSSFSPPSPALSPSGPPFQSTPLPSFPAPHLESLHQPPSHSHRFLKQQLIRETKQHAGASQHLLKQIHEIKQQAGESPHFLQQKDHWNGRRVSNEQSGRQTQQRQEQTGHHTSQQRNPVESKIPFLPPYQPSIHQIEPVSYPSYVQSLSRAKQGLNPQQVFSHQGSEVLAWNPAASKDNSRFFEKTLTPPCLRTENGQDQNRSGNFVGADRIENCEVGNHQEDVHLLKNVGERHCSSVVVEQSGEDGSAEHKLPLKKPKIQHLDLNVHSPADQKQIIPAHFSNRRPCISSLQPSFLPPVPPLSQSASLGLQDACGPSKKRQVALTTEVMHEDGPLDLSIPLLYSVPKADSPAGAAVLPRAMQTAVTNEGSSNQELGDATNIELHGASSTARGLTAKFIPGKKLLKGILDKLQKKDKFGVFSKPVDAQEVLDYYSIIKEPMDFGTMRKRVSAGHYTSLELFDKDVSLICNNAMQYNSKGTVYYRQARAIKEAFRKMVDHINTLKLGSMSASEILDEVKLRGVYARKNQADVHNASNTFDGSAKGTNVVNTEAMGSILERVSGNVQGLYSASPADFNVDYSQDMSGRRQFVYDENRRRTYQLQTLSDAHSAGSLVTAISGDPPCYLPTGYQLDFSYARSLARYAADLGPNVWKIAAEKIQKALPPGCPFGPGWVGERETLGAAAIVAPLKKLLQGSLACKAMPTGGLQFLSMGKESSYNKGLSFIKDSNPGNAVNLDMSYSSGEIKKTNEGTPWGASQFDRPLMTCSSGKGISSSLQSEALKPAVLLKSQQAGTGPAFNPSRLLGTHRAAHLHGQKMPVSEVLKYSSPGAMNGRSLEKKDHVGMVSAPLVESTPCPVLISDGNLAFGSMAPVVPDEMIQQDSWGCYTITQEDMPMQHVIAKPEKSQPLNDQKNIAMHAINHEITLRSAGNGPGACDKMPASVVSTANGPGTCGKIPTWPCAANQPINGSLLMKSALNVGLIQQLDTSINESFDTCNTFQTSDFISLAQMPPLGHISRNEDDFNSHAKEDSGNSRVGVEGLPQHVHLQKAMVRSSQQLNPRLGKSRLMPGSTHQFVQQHIDRGALLAMPQEHARPQLSGNEAQVSSTMVREFVMQDPNLLQHVQGTEISQSSHHSWNPISCNRMLHQGFQTSMTAAPDLNVSLPPHMSRLDISSGSDRQQPDLALQL